MNADSSRPASPAYDALAQLPHGREFRFLDRLLSLEPGVAGTGEYRLRGDEDFLRAEGVTDFAPYRCDPDSEPPPLAFATAFTAGKPA